MRVKLQLVICHDDGHEETVTDVITLNKNNQRIEHLGLSLAESKQLLRGCFENHAGLLAKRRSISRIIASFSRVSLVWSLRS
jgi:hypothetical protein